MRTIERIKANAENVLRHLRNAVVQDAVVIGRVSRGEFWGRVFWTASPLFILAIAWCVGWRAGANPNLLLVGAAFGLAWFYLGTIMSNLTGTVRQLHDSGHSGRWALFSVGFVFVLFGSMGVGPWFLQAIGYPIQTIFTESNPIVFTAEEAHFGAAVMLFGGLLGTLSMTPLLYLLALPGTSAPNEFGGAPTRRSRTLPLWRRVRGRVHCQTRLWKLPSPVFAGIKRTRALGFVPEGRRSRQT